MISMFGRYQRNAFYGHDGMLKSLQPNDKILFPPYQKQGKQYQSKKRCTSCS